MSGRLWVCAGLFVMVGCVPPVPTGRVASEIIGGAETASHPEVGGLLYDGDFLCSAVLVGPRKLVTAAHCVYGLEGDPAPLGAAFAASLEGAPQTGVAGVVVHPEYAASPSRDIAIVWLDADAPVPPVPWNDALDEGDLGGDVELVGYGDPAFGADDGERLRRTVTLPLEELTATHLRWNTVGAGTCHGDSGGGAFMDLGAGLVLVGVHSEGDPQCAGWGSATRADAFAAFLDDPEAGDDDDATGAFGDDDDAVEGATGCGCAAGGGGAPGWALLALLATLRRRARAPRPLPRAGSLPPP